MMTTLEAEIWDLMRRGKELPRLTYAGGQAGDGTGGAGGAGPNAPWRASRMAVLHACRS